MFQGVTPPTGSGIADGYYQYSSITPYKDNNFGIGAPAGSYTQFFIGTLKSIRYYDRVLTEEEILRNRNVDSVRYFGELGVTNVLVTTRFAAGGEQAESGAFKVEGSWDFTAATVLNAKGDVVPVAGYYIETLVGGEWTGKTWHEGTTYSYEEGTSPACVRLTWAPPLPGLTVIIR